MRIFLTTKRGRPGLTLPGSGKGGCKRSQRRGANGRKKLPQGRAREGPDVELQPRQDWQRRQGQAPRSPDPVNMMRCMNIGKV